jgi:GTPase
VHSERIVMAPPDQEYRSGFVALLGEPNVGKSTLLNKLLDFKVAIVSPKPQTTREAVRGIYSTDDCQIVFVDTPGVMEPRDKFNECLRDSALHALEGADAAYHLIEASQPHALPPAAAEALAHLRKPVFLVVNKSDLLPGFRAKKDPAALLQEMNLPFGTNFYREVFFVSALTGKGLDRLLRATRDLLPEGAPLYDPDQFTDRDLRFLAAEVVREKVLENTSKEVPYAVATQTEAFVEEPGRKHLIRVGIYVEHDSQKAIVIGRGGEMLRRIGAQARPEIEAICDHPVFLELWVKVRKNWRKDENALREFGYRDAAATREKKRRSKGRHG